MQERPIVFNADMIRAILEGRKTQTRRPLIKARDEAGTWAGAVLPAAESGWIAWWPGTEPGLSEFTKRAYRVGFPCPYGQTGDRLWVRETWAPCGDGGAVWYRAGVPAYRAGRWDGRSWEPFSPIYGLPIPRDIRWKPAIHMPRWASRLTLEVTDVRVQRLQEITDEAAAAEGVTAWRDTHPNHATTYVPEFRLTWDAIYAKRCLDWDAAPWVWAITFRRIDEQGAS